MKPLDEFRGSRVLITGGLGFLGSNLAIELVQREAHVTLLDSLIPQFGGNFANIEPIADRVTINISDMRDCPSLEILVRDKDFIFNLAGQVSHGDSIARSAARPGRQLRLDDEPRRGMPQAQPRRCGCSTPPPGRSMASPRPCRSRRTTCRSRSTSTASTSWRPSTITCSTTALTVSARRFCG